MTTGEDRGRVLGATVSLLFHAMALLALEARTTNRPFADSTREVVLEVEWWTGDEGQGATQSNSGPPADVPSSSAAPRSTDASGESDVQRSLAEASSSALRGRVARANNEPATGEPPLSEPLDERSSDALDRPIQPTDGSLAVQTLRHEVVKIGAAGPNGAVPRHNGSMSRQKAARAATEVARDHGSSRSDRKAAATGVVVREPSGASSTGGRAGAPGPRGNAGSPSELAAYLARVRARIASHQSAYGGEQGRVGIRFDVSADGTFTGLAVVSGAHGPLADAALRVVRRASPASPIPSSLGRVNIPVVVTVSFE